MLAIGAALLGACHVIGIDVDSDALETAQDNMDQFEDLPVGAEISDLQVQHKVLDRVDNCQGPFARGHLPGAISKWPFPRGYFQWAIFHYMYCHATVPMALYATIC